MTLLHLIILAFIQGLTEFLPISSSAHLILTSQWLQQPDQGLSIDVAVHVGTLLAVIVYFRRDLIRLLIAFFGFFKQSLNKEQQQEKQHLIELFIATLPAVLVGWFFYDEISFYLRNIQVIAIATIVFGLLLLIADYYGKKTLDSDYIGVKRALMIGLGQILAFIPGASRSGVTITAGLFMGLSRKAASRFSFLLSIPLIAAAGMHGFMQLATQSEAVVWEHIALIILISGVVAYTCIELFLRWIEKAGMMVFVIYRLLLGIILIFYFF